jgi:hypothetical protein
MRTGMHTRGTGRNRLGTLGLALALLALGLGACGDREEPRRGDAPQAGVESFTFLGMGRETEITDRLRGELSEKLGNAAVEQRGIIDLEAGTPGALNDLPALAAINRQLNSPPRERVEHDMIRLMYRYARSKETPFDLVELLFDPETRKPLLFRMRIKGDDAGMIEALRSKHGPPAAGGGRTLVWQKEGDGLVVAVVPDHLGHPVHHIAIFFTGNLQRRIAAEQAQAAEKAREKQPSGKSAF